AVRGAAPTPGGEGGGGIDRGWNGRDRLPPPHAGEEPGAPVDAENPLAHPNHRVDTREEALLQTGVEPAVQEGHAGAAPAVPAPGVQIEVLDGALAPELAHAAIRRPPIAVV